MNAAQHDPTADTAPRVRIDTSTPAPARRYDYLLGGKDNFAADRASAEAIAKRFPSVRIAALENRRFLHRVVRHIAGTMGIDQFIDAGTGIPTEPNVHQAERVARLVAALPPGSVLAISHVSFDLLPTDIGADLGRLNTPQAGHGTFRPRTRTEIAQFLGGLHLIEPGLVPINDWRPHLHPPPQATPDLTGFYRAMAYKP